jgi:hypothetical protein
LSIPHNAKIDLIIVGAQKSATTSLKHYLGEHPEIVAHPQKELSFFIDDKEYEHGVNSMMEKYFSNSGKSINGKKLVAKCALMYTTDKSLKRLKEYNPQSKIVLIIRNPVERTYSGYLMDKDIAGHEFNAAELKKLVKNQDDWKYGMFIDSSIYIKHLKNIYRYFPKEQVKVLMYENIKNNAAQVCREVFKWLGVSESFTPETDRKYNATRKKKSNAYSKLLRKVFVPHSVARKIFNTVVPEHYNYKVGEALHNLNKKSTGYDNMDAEAKTFLHDFYRPYNKELAELTGFDLSSWEK